MIDYRFVSGICDTYNLGLAMSPLEPVQGGLLHAMYSLRTTRGRYAVKVLDRHLVSTPGVFDEYRRSEDIARAFAANGVPAVCALEGRQGRLAEISSSLALVYPWIEGCIMPQDSAGPIVGRRIGSILGSIHTTVVDTAHFSAPAMTSLTLDEWNSLLGEGRERGAEWVDEIAPMIPNLMDWEAGARAAADDLGSDFVVSHRDLDQKNVLWSYNNAPKIVDWEGVGLVRPAVEAISTALDWSGQKAGDSDRATFVALLAGYRAKKSLAGRDCDLALKVLLGATGWLRANMRRSLEADRSPEERALRTREIGKYAQSLRSLAANLETWSEWCMEPAPKKKATR